MVALVAGKTMVRISGVPVRLQSFGAVGFDDLDMGPEPVRLA